jgi:diacylglycerol O-acyltransferase
MAQLIDPNSVVFLLNENRNQPMHVAGLQLFEKPPGAGPEFVREFYEKAIQTEHIAPLFLRRPEKLIPGLGPWAWTQDKQFDIEYHVRHSAVAPPGRIRELLELVSRLHGTVLARERPLWELHVIDGLADGRFALYAKMHHSLVDGVSAMKITERTMSSDPDQRDMPMMFDAAAFGRTRQPSQELATRSLNGLPAAALRSAYAMAAEGAGLPGAFTKTMRRGLRNQASAVSFYAPRSMFNVPITGARRFAADGWPLERLRAVGAAGGASLNDVVLAMCGGALRTYLRELNHLPDASLVAMVPVALKSRSATSESGGGGNAVGSVMVKLGTDVSDPADRLADITDSMKAGKDALSAMTPAQILAMTSLGQLPAFVLPALKLNGLVRPPYNLIISNVPGPRETKYINGARLVGTYPVSIPLNGTALNITCNSYADDMDFGLTGCRRTVPSLQRILTYLDDELGALEKAVGA